VGASSVGVAFSVSRTPAQCRWVSVALHALPALIYRRSAARLGWSAAQLHAPPCPQNNTRNRTQHAHNRSDRERHTRIDAQRTCTCEE
jgi:hypothetical protein